MMKRTGRAERTASDKINRPICGVIVEVMLWNILDISSIVPGARY